MMAFWGDSIFRGVVYSDGKYRMCSGAVDMLAQESSGSVKNYSRFGMNTGKAKLLFDKSIQDGSSNVFFEFGGNDCAFDWKQVSQNPYCNHIPQTPLSNFVQNMDYMIGKSKLLHKNVYVCTLPPIYSSYYFEHITRGLNAANILHWLGDIEHIHKHHYRYSAAVQNLALRHGVQLADLRRAFLDYGKYHELLCEDGIHPNQKGQTLIYEVMHNFAI